MASQLKVDTLTGVTTAGSIVVTGEGNSTTTSLQQGLAKAWINYAGDGTSIHDSLNMSSLDDDGAGQYTFHYSNNFNNNDYSSTYGVKEGSGGANFLASKNSGNYSTSEQEIRCWNYAGAIQDPNDASGTLHGDLA